MLLSPTVQLAALFRRDYAATFQTPLCNVLPTPVPRAYLSRGPDKVAAPEYQINFVLLLTFLRRSADCFTQRPRPYSAVNTFHLGYKNQSVLYTGQSSLFVLR
jgi:hypothetical protein